MKAPKKIRHVLLLSIDGMHAVDFYNCVHGVAGVNGGNPYCPNLAALGRRRSIMWPPRHQSLRTPFPVWRRWLPGGSPKTTGLYYDVAYDRSLDPPAITTGTGLAGGPLHALRVTDRNNNRQRPGHRH